MSFAGGREQRKYGAASSRDSLVDAINNRELGEAVNYDDRDEFSQELPTSFTKLITKGSKQIIPDIRKRMNELEEKSLKLAKINPEKSKTKVAQKRVKIIKNLRLLATQSERELFMNDKYIKLWKQLVAIVPKFEEELPTGGPMLGSLAIARGLMIIKGFTILDASLLIRKGGTCRHGRICCKVGHFVHGDKGVDFADLYLRKLHEEASFSEEKLDLLTLQLDKFGATLQKIDRVAFEVINSCLENLKLDIANASKKIENFDSLSSIKAVKKNKRVLLLDEEDDDDDDDDDSDEEGEQSVEQEHKYFENGYTGLDDGSTALQGSAADMKKNSNADYERFNSNHAPEDLPNSSVYRAHRDIIQERAGTVSVTQMMNSKKSNLGCNNVITDSVCPNFKLNLGTYGY